jgi:hypothetical protein
LVSCRRRFSRNTGNSKTITFSDGGYGCLIDFDLVDLRVENELDRRNLRGILLNWQKKSISSLDIFVGIMRLLSKKMH